MTLDEAALDLARRGFSNADTALRCAWLREHARHLFNVDPTGQLSVQLMDFADLLEVATDRGWFDAPRS